MEPVIIGQVDANMTTDITTDEELRVLLRVVWTAKNNEVAFKPAEDLSRGDRIRVTVEKVSEAPRAEEAEKTE
ncbi:MAG: hypothetical protein GX226_01405 [Dehalococcoidales bacterium]|jgi:hypothetical protein|nr:hypothetical protein [Dehalococcoidales bacterium]